MVKDKIVEINPSELVTINSLREAWLILHEFYKCHFPSVEVDGRTTIIRFDTCHRLYLSMNVLISISYIITIYEAKILLPIFFGTDNLKELIHLTQLFQYLDLHPIDITVEISFDDEEDFGKGFIRETIEALNGIVDKLYLQRSERTTILTIHSVGALTLEN